MRLEMCLWQAWRRVLQVRARDCPVRAASIAQAVENIR